MGGISRADEANVVVAGNKTLMTWELDYPQICSLVGFGREIMLGKKDLKSAS